MVFLHVMSNHLELEESVFRTSLCGLLWTSVTLCMCMCVHTHVYPCVRIQMVITEKNRNSIFWEPGLIVLGILQLISSPCTPAKHLLPTYQPDI